MAPMPLEAPVTRAVPFEVELLILFSLVELLIRFSFPFIFRFKLTGAGLAPGVVLDFRFSHSDQIARLKRHRNSNPLTIQKCPVGAAGIAQQDLTPFAFEFGVNSR